MKACKRISGDLPLWRLTALLALFLAMAPGQLAAGQIIVKDAIGQSVAVPPARRILTLGSDVTEIVYALGAGDRVVAVDRGSRYPEDTANKPNVGYRRQLAVEGVISLDPDLIIAAEDIGPPEAVEVLRSLDIPIVFTPEDNSGNGIRRKIELIAATLDLKPEGETLSASVLEELRAVQSLVDRIPEQGRRKVVFFHGLVRLTAAGNGTAADAIIKLAGGQNPMDVVDGYKAASEEKLIEMAPDVILMMGDGKGGPTPGEVFSNTTLAATPAAKTRSLVVLDGPYMIGFGPRTASAVRDLAIALYGANALGLKE